MSLSPWYLNAQRPSLKHQKNWKLDSSNTKSWYDRGATILQAYKYSKGACANCGATTHIAKDSVDRTRKVGAKWTNENIAHDEKIETFLISLVRQSDLWRVIKKRVVIKDASTSAPEQVSSVRKRSRSAKAAPNAYAERHQIPTSSVESVLPTASEQQLDVSDIIRSRHTSDETSIPIFKIFDRFRNMNTDNLQSNSMHDRAKFTIVPQGCARMASKTGGFVGGGNWKYEHGTTHYGQIPHMYSLAQRVYIHQNSVVLYWDMVVSSFDDVYLE
ncbi:pre-mRNA-splicing factor SLU7-A [Tanacetum coccineum]